jgi:hypothetical protein
VAAVGIAFIFGLSLYALTGLIGGRGASVGSGGIVRVPVPAPQPLAAGEGAVWVVGGLSDQGGLWRVDPTTDRARLVAGTEGAWWPATGEGAAWVTTCRPGDKTDCARADLLRIDPASGTLTASLRLPAPPMQIAAGLGSVWISADQHLLKIDPVSMSIVGEIPLHTNLLGTAGGFLWATVGGAGATGVDKIDPSTGRVLAHIPFGDPCTFAASGDLVAVASCQGGLPPGSGPDHLVGIDPSTATVLYDVPLSSYGGLAFAAGYPWIASWTKDPERVEVRQLDASTGLPTGVSVSLGPGPRPWMELGMGAPGVFVATSDGSFWLTHVDADDVVRVDVPVADASRSSSSAGAAQGRCVKVGAQGDFDDDGTPDTVRLYDEVAQGQTCHQDMSHLLHLSAQFGSGGGFDIPFSYCQGGACSRVLQAVDLDGDGRSELVIEVGPGAAIDSVELFRVSADGIIPLRVAPPGDPGFVEPGPAILGGSFDSGGMSPVSCRSQPDGTTQIVSVHAAATGDLNTAPWDVHRTVLALQGDTFGVVGSSDQTVEHFQPSAPVFSCAPGSP